MNKLFFTTRHVTDVLSDPLKRRVDLLIILVKHYIYASKYLQKELSLDELVNKQVYCSMENRKCAQIRVQRSSGLIARG